MSIDVAIIMGSKSDWDIMSHSANILTQFNISHESKVISAHRTPELLDEYCSEAQQKGVKIFITGAGLGLIQDAIIDQHFIKRSRYNRLISAVMDYPELMGIGIDESTAILVDGQGNAEVVGVNQVIVLRNTTKEKAVKEGKMGANGLQMDILLPGDTFKIQKVK